MCHWAIDEVAIRRFLARHQAGDWGAHGTHADQALAAAEVWMLPLLSIEAQNRHAVRMPASAVVRSRYLLDARSLEAAHRGRPVWQAITEAFCEITTATGGSPETMVSLSTTGG